MRAGKKEREANLKRAQAALTKFRSMTPMLTGFLRGITGQKHLVLEAGAMTASTSKKVTICPPVALGASYRHPSRRLCGQRDENSIPVCEGCRAWEAVFVSLLHEMSHVAFTRMDSAEFNSAYRSALPVAAGILGVKPPKNLEARYAKQVDPYLPIVANSLEDIRVDSAMVAQRPGVDAMQRASYNDIMSGTFEVAQPNGDVTTLDWAEAEPTAQVTCSLIAVGLGYGIHPSMKPETRDFMEREDVSRICAEVVGSDLHTVIVRSAEIISLGRADGLFPLDENEDGESENGEDGEGGGGNEGEGESGQGGAGQSGTIPEGLAVQMEAVGEQGHDSDGTQARSDAGQPDSQGGQQQPSVGAPSRGSDKDDAMAVVLKQDGWTDTPSVEFGGVDFSRYDRTGGSCGQEPTESILGAPLGKLRAVLAPNQLHQQSRHLRAGRLDSRILGRRAPVDDDRLFMRKQVNTKRDFFWVLGLDVSGSTGAAVSRSSSRRIIDVLVSAAWAQAELLNRLGMPFTIVTHTTGDGWDNDITVALREIKGPNEPWNAETKSRLRAIRPQSGNLDARAMVAFRKIAERYRAREKFIIQYSDGQFPVMNEEDETRVIAEEIANHKRDRNLHFMMVGIKTDSPSRFGFDFVRVDDESQTMKVVNQIERAVR